MRDVSKLLAALFVSAAASGCTLLLDFDAEGLACDSDGQCRPHYVCNGQNQCMAEGHPSTLCEPGCGPLQTCVRAECVPICDDRACPAAHSCVEGSCEPNPRELKLGSPCMTDDDCTNTADTCLLPYGGGTGVCTRMCDTEADCDSRAPECVAFASGEQTRRLCANAAFRPCGSEAACTESGLSCGVYAYRSGTLVEPIAACIARRTGATIGAICSSGIPCANGLCVLMDDASGQEICTTPCADNTDCEDVLGGPGHECTPVTLNAGRAGAMPAVRPKMCSKGGKSLGVPCNLGCKTEAPYCAGEGTERKCRTACGDGDRECPSLSPVCGANPDPSGPDLCFPQ